MRYVWFALLALFLSACASQSGGPGRDSDALASANPRARIHTELAAQYYARRQFSVALQELREVIAADSGYAPAYNMLGLVHAALLEDKEADGFFRRAIDLAPEYSEAHNNYGLFLCQRERRAQAMEHFERAWNNPLYTTPEKALANAGHCALRGGQMAEAERFAQRALVRVPSQPQALATMAEIQYRRGNLVTARTLLRQLDEMGVADPGVYWLGLKLERAAGNREAEADYGSRLRRQFPESAEALWLINGRYDMPSGGMQ